jgi:hypothetical protein
MGLYAVSLRKISLLKCISQIIFFFKVIEQAKRLYPEWIIRIFHDNSIDTSIICQIECDMSRNSNSRVDFCNIEQLPFGLKKTWHAKYMHVCMCI